MFSGEQKVAYVSEWFDIGKFKTIHKDFKNKKISVELNGKCLKTSVIREPLRKHKMYEITVELGKSFVVSDKHIHDTDNGEKLTTELTTEDYICLRLHGNNHWDRIKSVTEVEVKDKHMYTFDTESFVLPNGIVVRGVC